MGTSLLFVLLLYGASVVRSAHSSLTSERTPTSLLNLQQSTQCLDTCCNRSVACSETHGDKISAEKTPGANLNGRKDPPLGVTSHTAGGSTRGATAGAQGGAGGLGKGSAQRRDHRGDPPPTQGRAAMFVRRPGESTKTYLERIDIESKSCIAGCFRKENKKSDRRKK